MPAVEIKGLQGGFASAPVGAKIFLLVALIIVMSSGYYATIHMSLVDDIEAAQTNHKRLKKSLIKAQERQKVFLELREELASREVIDRQNYRVLPKDKEIPAFLGDINRLAELSGVKIRFVRPMEEESAEFYFRVPMSMGFSGTYHQLAKFFYNVSRLERAVNIENLSLNRRSESTDKTIVLESDALATTFRRKEE